MKYLRLYEDYESVSDFKEGDFVICVRDFSANEARFGNVNLVKGEKYRVVRFMDDKDFIEIQDKDGNIECFYKNRFIPEVELDANKYNL